MVIHPSGVSAMTAPASAAVGGVVPSSGVSVGGTVHTYEDHRIAMAFGILGAVIPGISVEDPGCVAKTFPGFWSVLESARPPVENRGYLS